MVSASGLSMNLVENGVVLKVPTFGAYLVHEAEILAEKCFFYPRNSDSNGIIDVM